jgi:hypothetical protein
VPEKETKYESYYYNGKHINVHLSTSTRTKYSKDKTSRDHHSYSNYSNSCPKSATFSQNNYDKLESSILCYRASDSEGIANRQQTSTDWIQLIENGSLPVLNENQSDESLNGESFSHLPLLSDIPTPDCPDFFSIKIPAIKSNLKKSISFF